MVLSNSQLKLAKNGRNKMPNFISNELLVDVRNTQSLNSNWLTEKAQASFYSIFTKMNHLFYHQFLSIPKQIQFIFGNERNNFLYNSMIR